MYEWKNYSSNNNESADSWPFKDRKLSIFLVKDQNGNAMHHLTFVLCKENQTAIEAITVLSKIAKQSK